jgi:phosphoglycolate phosphatase
LTIKSFKEYFRNNMNAKGIIFDLDGTLTDTLDDIAEYMNSALEQKGLPTHPVDAYRFKVGWGMKVLVQLSVPEGVTDPELLASLETNLSERYASEPVGKTRLYPGIGEMLSWLEERSLPKGILSNKDHNLVVEVVNTLLGSWRFHEVMGAQAEFPRKPAPESALAVAGVLKIPPENIVFIGDSGVDMQTARNAGMIPMGVSWGFREKDELIDEGALGIFESPMDIKKLFI